MNQSPESSSPDSQPGPAADLQSAAEGASESVVPGTAESVVPGTAESVVPGTPGAAVAGASEPAPPRRSHDQPGSFYLGRVHDLATGETSARKVLYDSKDLTTHAVCVGMTGSGKTGLCLSLLEEAALDGIPAIAIDPKGDLGNLLLAFPELRPEDFQPWVDAGAARRQGVTTEEYATQTAALWRSGLENWDQDGARIRAFNERVDKVIYTPGSTAGIPLTVLKSFSAPSAEVLQDTDALGQRVQSAASGVLALLGTTVDPVTSPEHILISNVLAHAWRGGRDLDLIGLIREIQNPPFTRVGVVDVETFLPAKERLALGMKLNNLLASPSFASWLTGESLDIQRLLYDASGKPRLAIISIAHLNDTERMFFVTILLNEVLSWMRSQPGTSSLRALLYMDEVFGFFPPVGNPPSKQPMLTLLKQARAFGLGCVLATQNPVDLDYKGLSNAGTWFLGRLQTERDKARVMEGLEGVAAQAGARFDRGAMERQLAALGSRVFLMNNVHDSAPTIFHTRWALSYLSGPLSRVQIGQLMDERRAAEAAQPPSAAATPSPKQATEVSQSPAPSSTPDAPAGSGWGGDDGNASSLGQNKLLLSSELPQRYFEVAGEAPPEARLLYRPALVAVGRLHYVKASDNIDEWVDVTTIQWPQGERLPSRLWDEAETRRGHLAFAEQSPAEARGTGYAELPAEMTQPKNYRGWGSDWKDWLYRTQRLRLWESPELALRSEVGESEAEFRIRVTQRARELRDTEKQAIRDKYAIRSERQQKVVERAQAQAEEQQAQFWARLGQMLWRVLEILLIRLSGGSTRRKVVTSTSTSQAMRDRQQHSRAEEKLAAEIADLQRIERERDEALEEVEFRLEPAQLRLQGVEVPPRKGDIDVMQVLLAWFPWWETPQGPPERAYRLDPPG